MITVTQMQYAIAVLKNKSFSAAAKYCNVSQPTLSQQIAKMEDILGCVVFDRNLQPTEPTSLGLNLIRQMIYIMEQMDQLKSLAQHPDSLVGLLKIAIIPTLSVSLLPYLIPLLQSKTPGIRFEIEELQTQHIVERLLNETLDAAICVTPLEVSSLHSEVLFYEPLWVCAHPQHPLATLTQCSQDHLSAEGLWLLQEGHCLRGQMLNLCQISQYSKLRDPQNVLLDVGNLACLGALVEKSGGYTILPQLSLPSAPSNVKLLPFEAPIPCREVSFVSARPEKKKHLFDAFLVAVHESLPQDILNFDKSGVKIIPL